MEFGKTRLLSVLTDSAVGNEGHPLREEGCLAVVAALQPREGGQRVSAGGRLLSHCRYSSSALLGED